jgi:hypothetical protein
MKTYTIDNLVREALSERGYTMHWYLQFLQYAITGLRELNFDVLQMVKSVKLPVNSYKAVKLPCDFVDVVRLGNESGQYVYPWAEKKSSFNRLNKLDDSGNKVPYGDIQAQNGILPNNWEGFWYSNYINDKGEHLGRIFNNFPSFRESFVVLRERDEIQLDVSIVGTSVVLDYISDGLTTDSTNAVHPYAADTLKKCILWNYKKNGRQYPLSERQLAEQEYYNALRILRARMNNIDTNDIDRVMQRGYGPTIKN